MFVKKPSHRKFEYQPRHYKPQMDEDEKRKRRLGFSSGYRNKTTTKMPYAYIIMLAIIVYVFLKFNGLI